MTPELLSFFAGQEPEALALYLTLEGVLRNVLPPFDTRVQKTQISWYTGALFGCVSIPRKRADRPGILVTFGLDHPVQHEKILLATEPYPGRWTHHTLVRTPEDIDEHLLSWLSEAQAFAASK